MLRIHSETVWSWAFAAAVIRFKESELKRTGTMRAFACPFAILGRSNDVRFVLLGGTAVGANTLLRFYVLHCVALPLVAGALMIVHFWRVRKDGGISGPAPVMLESEIKEDKGPRPVIMRPSGMV